jgi:superfamily I DNA and/or RNA helicase
MYVTTRFDNSVKVINLASKQETGRVAMTNPESQDILNGRKFLYDANLSSANGESSCSSCHIFGDEDALAWDLGNPDDVVTKSPIKGQFTDATTFQGAKLIFAVNGKINGSDNPKDFHPMKGPMATQSLRGMANQGAQHWRGDRSVGLYGTSATDDLTSFINFGVAFEGLLGNKDNMSKEGMTTFANFMLKVVYPPNPIH